MEAGVIPTPRAPRRTGGLLPRPAGMIPGCWHALRAAILAAAASAALVVAQAPPIETGRSAYLRECAGCHGESGRGDGPDAPFLASAPADLRRGDVLRVYQDDALVARIREGKALALELRPEALREHARETEALYEFLRRFPAIDWEKTEAGRDLYLTRCPPCHDPYGHPVSEPMKGVRKEPRDLADPTFQGAVTDQELYVLARHGKAAMPALVPRVREEEAVPLVSFIRLLSPGYEIYSRYCEDCHGADGRGADGPFAELGAPRFAFDANYFANRDKERIQGAIWHMLQNAKPQMPHFAASLSRTDLEAILTYLRSLPPPVPTEDQP